MHAWMSRYIFYALTIALTGVFVALGMHKSPHFFWGVLAFGPLAILGTWDIVQTRHRYKSRRIHNTVS